MDQYCGSYQRAIELIGRRWTGSIVRALLTGGMTFTELRTAIPGVSDRLVSERLRELEAEGLVERQAIGERPIRVRYRYRLSPKGQALKPVLEVVDSWADTWLLRSGEAGGDEWP